MKIVLKHALAVVAIALCAAGIVSPQAVQAATPTVIVVVSMDVILSQSQVGKSVATQLQSYSTALQAEAKKSNDSIQAEAKKLSKDRALMQPADFNKKVTALQQREGDLQRRMGEKGQELQLAEQKARSQIDQALGPIITDIMTKNGANVVLEKGSTLITTPELDITPEVLRRLNEKLTQLTVKPIPLASLQQPAPAGAKKPAAPAKPAAN